MKRCLSVTLVIVGVVALTASIALAKKTYKTKTSLTVGTESVTGKVTSPKAACYKHRKLAMEYATIGTHIPYATHTDNSGKWEIPFAAGTGTYKLTITVAPKSLGHGKVCGSAGKSKIS